MTAHAPNCCRHNLRQHKGPALAQGRFGALRWCKGLSTSCVKHNVVAPQKNKGAAAVAYNIDGAQLAAALAFEVEAGQVRSTPWLEHAPGEAAHLGDEIPTPRVELM